jgi:Flp pilus assembly protein TadG
MTAATICERDLLSPYVKRRGLRMLGARKRYSSDRGQALVEFALILPVFVLLVLGMIDFGIAYNDHNDMTQLAGEAVRYASVNSCGPSCTGSSAIVNQVIQDADNESLKTGSSGVFGTDQPLQVCFWYPAGNNTKSGDPVTAIVETNYRWLPFLNLGAVQLRTTATMRLETALKNDGTDVYTVAGYGSNIGDCPGYSP